MGTVERREKEKQEMREAILRTAMKLFLEKGFENISLRRIAEKIEYSPATIYLYFKNKDEILYALHTRGFEELYRRQQAMSEIRDPLKRLRRHAEIYVSFALENPEYYDLMFIMRSPVKKILEKKEWDTGMRSYDLLRQNVKDCIDAGLMPRTSVDLAAFACWSLVHGVAALVIRERCVMFPKDQLPSIIKGSLDFMFAGLLKK